MLDKPEYQGKRADLIAIAQNGIETIKHIADPLMLEGDSVWGTASLKLIFDLPVEQRDDVLRHVIPLFQIHKIDRSVSCSLFIANCCRGRPKPER